MISHQLDQLEDLMGVNGFEGFPAHGVKNRQYLRIAAAERIGQAKKRYRHMAARHGS